jgi:hypothetical protein
MSEYEYYVISAEHIYAFVAGVTTGLVSVVFIGCLMAISFYKLCCSVSQLIKTKIKARREERV